VRDLARLGHRKRRDELDRRQPDRLRRQERRGPVNESGTERATAAAQRAIRWARAATLFAGASIRTRVRRDGGKEPGRQDDRQQCQEETDPDAHAQNLTPCRWHRNESRRSLPRDLALLWQSRSSGRLHGP